MAWPFLRFGWVSIGRQSRVEVPGGGRREPLRKVQLRRSLGNAAPPDPREWSALFLACNPFLSQARVIIEARFRRHTLLGAQDVLELNPLPLPSWPSCLGTGSSSIESSEHPVKFLATWCQVKYDPRRLFRRMRCPTPFHQSRLAPSALSESIQAPQNAFAANLLPILLAVEQAMQLPLKFLEIVYWLA